MKSCTQVCEVFFTQPSLAKAAALDDALRMRASILPNAKNEQTAKKEDEPIEADEEKKLFKQTHRTHTHTSTTTAAAWPTA